MSALPPKADMARTLGDVRYVPLATKVQCGIDGAPGFTLSVRGAGLARC